MIIVHGQFSLHEHSIEKFLALFDAMRTTTIAEPGNLAYRLYRGIDSTPSFLIIEQWRSREALTDHLHADHTQGTSADLVDCLAAAPVLEIFDGDGPLAINDLRIL